MLFIGEWSFLILNSLIPITSKSSLSKHDLEKNILAKSNKRTITVAAETWEQVELGGSHSKRWPELPAADLGVMSSE